MAIRLSTIFLGFCPSLALGVEVAAVAKRHGGKQRQRLGGGGGHGLPISQKP